MELTVNEQALIEGALWEAARLADKDVQTCETEGFVSMKDHFEKKGTDLRSLLVKFQTEGSVYTV